MVGNAHDMVEPGVSSGRDLKGHLNQHYPNHYQSQGAGEDEEWTLALTPGRVVGSADSSLRTVEKTPSQGWPTAGDPPLQVHSIYSVREGKGHVPVCMNREKTGKPQVFFTYYPLLCFSKQSLSLASSLTCRLDWLARTPRDPPWSCQCWGYKQVLPCMD